MEIESVEPIVPPRPVVRRPILLLTALGLTVMIAGALLVLNRRHVNTFTSERYKPSGLAFTVAYSDDWTIDNSPNNGTRPTLNSGSPDVELLLAHRPPTGFARWWMVTVLREEMTDWNRDNLIVALEPRSGEYASLAFIEAQAAQVPASRGIAVHMHRFMHRLGPALDVVMTYAPQPNVPTTVIGSIPVHSHFALIFPEDSPQHKSICLIAAMTMYKDHTASVEPAFQTLLDSLRFADTR